MECPRKSLTPIRPVTTTLFAEKPDPAKVNFVIRKMLEMGKIPFGNFRDGNAIAGQRNCRPC
jgi:hypothetical protein